MLPKVFIGSSMESRGIAATLQAFLEGDANVTVWTEAFALNRGNLENLMSAVSNADFACVFATADDWVTSRGKESLAPRDNLIFEFGLFLSALGLDRTFLVHPRLPGLKLPSDLAGVTLLGYKLPNDQVSIADSLSPVAEKIRQHIVRLGLRDVAGRRRHSPILERCGVDRISMLSDAALYFQRPRFGYRQTVRQYIVEGRPIPTSYFFVTEEGAKRWLEQTTSKLYQFQDNSRRLIRAFANTFAELVWSSVSGNRVDYVGLGSGDGMKDRALLTALMRGKSRSVSYYPIDLSDKLLVECVRNVFDGPLDYDGLRTKVTIGDFTNLRVLRSVFEDRPSPNVFSVLGNTFGNTDEAAIMQALDESMYEGDLLLLEINCDPGEIELGSRPSFLTSKEALEYACLPIEILGLEVDLRKAEVREEPELSAFRCARSAVAYYSDIVVDQVPIDSVSLFHNHRYAFDPFTSELSETLNIEILAAQVQENAGIVLGRRRSESGD